MTILSELPDGCGFYYAFHGNDSRRIDVRWEPSDNSTGGWEAYVAGEPIGCFANRKDAEESAILWLENNPIDQTENTR